MGRQLADVLIHVKEVLDENGVRELEAEIFAQEGVAVARHRAGFTHMLQVRFDPDAIHAHELLSPVRALGFEAQLIGL